jgi:hypothetical protein
LAAIDRKTLLKAPLLTASKSSCAAIDSIDATSEAAAVVVFPLSHKHERYSLHASPSRLKRVATQVGNTWVRGSKRLKADINTMISS